MPKISFYKLKLESGGVLILRLQQVTELLADEVPVFEQAASRFKSNRCQYDITMRGTNKAIIAGLIRDFGVRQFTRDDVIRWCAFVGLEFSEHEISAALANLADEDDPPITTERRGAGASWTANELVLERYLRR